MNHTPTKRHVRLVLTALTALGVSSLGFSAPAPTAPNSSTDFTSSMAALNALGSGGGFTTNIQAAIDTLQQIVDTETANLAIAQTARANAQADYEAALAVSDAGAAATALAARNAADVAISSAQSKIDLINGPIFDSGSGTGAVTHAQQTAAAAAQVFTDAAAAYAQGTEASGGLQSVIDSINGVTSGDPSVQDGDALAALTAYNGSAQGLADIADLANATRDALNALPPISDADKTTALDTVLNGAWERDAIMDNAGRLTLNEDATATNTQAIADEATTRADADTALQNNIDAEAVARADADTALQGNIDVEAATRADADTALQSNIDAEAVARADADTVLQGNIDAEATTRADADTALQSNIDAEAVARADADTVLQGNIDAEAVARADADTVLQGNIDAEAATRADADTALQNNIDAEAVARADADTVLQGNIDAEATTRADADTALQSNIDVEATTRADADTALQNNIDAEAVARADADTALQNNIDAEAVARADADTALQGNIDAEVAERSSLIRREADGIHIGENSLITNEVGGEQQLFAKDAGGNAIDINVTNGSRLLYNGDEVATQVYVDNAIGTVNNRIDGVEAAVNRNSRAISKLRRGVAMAAALQTPVIAEGHNNAIKVGVAHFDGETGLAAGYARRVNDSVTLNAELATTDGFDETIARGGLNFSW